MLSISVGFTLFTTTTLAQWVHVSENYNVNGLAIEDNNIIAGTGWSGVYLSTDFGATWDSVNNGLPYSYTVGMEINSILVS
ncbi:MAG TPA: hypothetical protein VFA55_04325, partial [Candidatus Kapabacteria bacterium]|nr:hypothetical protein [Candidatus Kapabacteria bacterium]